jgi:hypothetical protein
LVLTANELNKRVIRGESQWRQRTVSTLAEFNTIASNCSWQASQRYSKIGMAEIYRQRESLASSTRAAR